MVRNLETEKNTSQYLSRAHEYAGTRAYGRTHCIHNVLLLLLVPMDDGWLRVRELSIYKHHAIARALVCAK